MQKYRLPLLLLILVVSMGALVYKFFLRGDGLDLSEDFPRFKASSATSTRSSDEPQLATFGGGCFWCTEAFFEELPGVLSVESGFSGGRVVNPSYAEVCAGGTGHAEVVQVRFDPTLISYPELLEVFWRTHDPTTLNRQGNDIGPQYRSVIFFHSPEQGEIARDYKQLLNDAGTFRSKIVTQIEPFKEFYRADGSHQDYFRSNPNAMYCRMLIGPKIKKFEKFTAGRFEKP